MPDPTPGQVAYKAFHAATTATHWVRLAWSDTSPSAQAAWEAAAQAVLADYLRQLGAALAPRHAEHEEETREPHV